MATLFRWFAGLSLGLLQRFGTLLGWTGYGLSADYRRGWSPTPPKSGPEAGVVAAGHRLGRAHGDGAAVSVERPAHEPILSLMRFEGEALLEQRWPKAAVCAADAAHGFFE